MATKPWLTSNELIKSVKRTINIPNSQSAYTDEDILAFAHEEMMISMVPQIMEFHESYFVYRVLTPLLSNQSRYQIPSRAIGMRLRDVALSDSAGHFYEMTRISDGDKGFYQGLTGSKNLSAFYLEGNEVVLSPGVRGESDMDLNFFIFLRPNRLVNDERAATITEFTKTITVDNASLTAGDTLIIGDLTFTAVSSSPSDLEFQIGATSVDTATNLKNAITLDGTYDADNGTPATAVVRLYYSIFKTTIESDTDGLEVQSEQGIVFDSVPTTYTNPITNVTETLFASGVKVDFLQTEPGHRTYKYDVVIPENGISDNIITFNSDDLMTFTGTSNYESLINLVVGDYICLANECIIPQIPTDLHTSLVQQVCKRVLSAQGDQEGVNNTNAKLSEIARSQGTLLDARVENAPKKFNQRHSLTRFRKFRWYRGI